MTDAVKLTEKIVAFVKDYFEKNHLKGAVLGISGGKDSGKNNLPDENFDDFAEFLAEAVLRIQKEYGIKFDTLEPFNESDTNYWGYEGWQEGCHFDVEDHSRLILL